MDLLVILCLCGVVPVGAIVLTAYLLKKGLDLVLSCLGNVFVLAIAGILLTVYLHFAGISICQVWWVGEPICSFMSNF